MNMRKFKILRAAELLVCLMFIIAAGFMFALVLSDAEPPHKEAMELQEMMKDYNR